MSENSGKRGYGKPPPGYQFKPGQSGNPKGRPPGSRNMRAEMSKAWHSTRVITIDGKRKRLSHVKIGAMNIAIKASKADHRAYQTQLENEDTLAAQIEARRQAFSHGSRADALTMESIVERIRASANKDEDPAQSEGDTPPDGEGSE